MLVYNVDNAAELYRRYPGVDGSLYFIGGAGMTYHRSGNAILAPIRLGLGWRQGASVGYLHVTPRYSIIPF